MHPGYEFYYKAKKGLRVLDIVKKWQEEGGKISNDPYFFDTNDLWQYRDYDWNRENARGGHAYSYYFNQKQPFIKLGSEKWDKMLDHMKQYGWNPREPAMLTVGKDGRAKVGEGNHRLAIAKELGIQEIPVRLFFYQKVIPTSDTSREPRIAEFRQWLENNNPNILYHHSNPINRLSILTNGLQTKYDRTGDKNSIKGIYLTDLAKNYPDTWEIDVRSIPIEEDYSNSEEASENWYVVYQNIPKEKIKLISQK